MAARASLCAAAFALVLACGAVCGAETPKPAAAPASVDAANVYSPMDLDALRQAIGRTTTVEGTIVASGENKSKTVRYLNFTKNYHESLGLVFFVSKGGDKFSIEKLGVWVGKKVRATGKVSEYQGALQIAIDDWQQVKEAR